MRGRRLLFCLMGLWLMAGLEVRAAEPEQWMMDELEFGDIEESVNEELDTKIDFSDSVVKAVEGKEFFSLQNMTEQVVTEVHAQWERQKSDFFSILALTVCAAFLVNFSGIFKSQQIAEVSFEITYMLLFLILLKGFREAVGVTEDVMEGMSDFMTALIPAYFLSVSLAGSAVTAGVFYPFLLGVIHAARGFMEIVLLPLLEGYAVLVFVNHLTGEKHLGRLSDGILSGCSWVLRSMLAVVAGFHLIQGMVSPAVDALKSTTVSRAVAAVPGVGNLAGSVTDVILGSGMLIKNGIGAVGLVILVSICVVPLARLGSFVLLLEVLAIVIQPVSDKRMVGCIAGISGAGKLLFRMVFTLAALFLLSIALITVLTGVRV